MTDRTDGARTAADAGAGAGAKAGGHEVAAAALDYPSETVATRTLVLASTPRSGSTLLSRRIAGVRVLGAPVEYWAKGVRAEMSARLGAEGQEALVRALLKARTAETGIFSAKIMHRHLAEFGGFAEMVATFPDPVFVEVSRRDSLAQAISQSKALQDGRWQSQRVGTGQAARYDFELIDKAHRDLLKQTASWRYEIARSGLPSMSLVYEDFRDDPDAAVRNVADFVGVDLPSGTAPAAAVEQPSRQSNAGEVEEWKARYVRDADRRGLFWSPPAPPRGLLGRARRAIGR